MFKIEANLANFPIWVLLGPFFLFVTFFVSTYMPISNLDLFLLSIFGIAVCVKFSMKGLGFSLITLLAFLTLKHLQISNNHLWQLGLECSVALGFLITALSLDRSYNFVNQIDEEKTRIHSDLQQVQEEITKEKDFQEKQNHSLRKELEEYFWKVEEKGERLQDIEKLILSIKDQNEQLIQDRENLLTEINRRNKQLLQIEEEKNLLKEKVFTLSDENSLLAKNQELLDQLNDLRKEFLQLGHVKEKFTQELEEQTKKHQLLEEEKKQIEMKLQELKNNAKKLINPSSDRPEKVFSVVANPESGKLQALYKQLKRQFIEKDQQLHSARSELFNTQEKILSIRHQEKLALGHMPLHEQQLAKRIAEAEAEYALLQEENSELKGFLSNLLEKE